MASVASHEYTVSTIDDLKIAYDEDKNKSYIREGSWGTMELLTAMSCSKMIRRMKGESSVERE